MILIVPAESYPLPLYQSFGDPQLANSERVVSLKRLKRSAQSILDAILEPSCMNAFFPTFHLRRPLRLERPPKALWGGSGASCEAHNTHLRLIEPLGPVWFGKVIDCKFTSIYERYSELRNHFKGTLSFMTC